MLIKLVLFIFILFIVVILSITGVDAKKIQLKDLVFTINQPNNQKVSEKLIYPAKLPTKLSKIRNTDTIKISFTPVYQDNDDDDTIISEIKQASLIIQSNNPILRISNQLKSKLDVGFIFEKLRGSRDNWNLTIDMGSESTIESFLGHTGSYTLTLYLSIATTSSSKAKSSTLSYDLGSIQIEFPNSIKLNIKPSVPENFILQPEIHHVFKTSDKIASKWLTVLFSILVLAPWSFLIMTWGLLGANIKNFFEPSTFISGSGFFTTLVGWVYLFYQYWMRLNLFQLLYYGSILGVLTIILGRRSLVDRAQLRFKKGY